VSDVSSVIGQLVAVPEDPERPWEGPKVAGRIVAAAILPVTMRTASAGTWSLLVNLGFGGLVQVRASDAEIILEDEARRLLKNMRRRVKRSRKRKIPRLSGQRPKGE
jgi:hypothetical protein